MNDFDMQRALRELPPVDLLVSLMQKRLVPGEVPRDLLLAWVRQEVDEARARIREERLLLDRDAWTSRISEQVVRRMETRRSHGLRRVVNATGILIHTNLGRSPLPAAAQAALGEATAGYCNLETDLETGERCSRLDPIRRLLPLVTGAEAGIAVHNNAAAVYLALTALASGRDVVVSRGHLVEIGGSFRLPEIMAASGARLVEVGSTNRTRLDDYARVLGPSTALLLKVHPSNFRLIGFTEEVATRDLAELARRHGVPLLHDVGSGALSQHGSLAFDEPRVQDSLTDGADLVCFSGDKLLGGPQAGILVGKKVWIDRLSQHPVARVVRLEKTMLAALEATLETYLDTASLLARVPLLRLLSRSAEELEECAESLASALRESLPAEWQIEVVPTRSQVGGGTLPEVDAPSRAVALSHPGWSLEEIARALRRSRPPVVGRIEKGRYLLDVRALLPGEERLVVEGTAALTQSPGGAA